MGFFWAILAIIIISTVIGAVSKMFANINEMNAAARQRPPAPHAGGTVRQANSDMDRFLAEIDRLRKKSAEAPPPTPQAAPPAAVPVVQPAKQPERPRTRVVAELAEPTLRPVPVAPVGPEFAPPQAAPPTPVGPLPGDAPKVVAPPSGTGAPATRVTRIAGRPRPVAKTPFAKSLTALLASGQGPAMAIVLREVLGPPKSRKA
jgi:hypothetical protein